MIYSDWTTALAGYLPENLATATAPQPFVAGSRYNAVLARCIEYAELRIYREPDLDFLATRAYVAAPCIPGARAVALPSGMLVVEEANVITPAGVAPDAPASVRTPLEPASVAFINRAWPAIAVQQIPEHYARIDNGNIIFGAVPDQAYQIEFYGTVRPAALAASNPSTFLTKYLPDLFMAASMIFMSGYQKTFGAMSGDPQQGLTWEQYYGELKRGAAIEEARKKFRSADGSALSPSPAAPPA